MNMTIINPNWRNYDMEDQLFRNNSVLNIDRYAHSAVNFRAEIDPSLPTRSVHFWLDQTVFRIENSAPYAFNVNNGDVYAPWIPPLGRHTITATFISID